MVTAPDHYAGTAADWHDAASRVYGPLAVELVRRSPHPLVARLVLDAGAGTGCGTEALVAAGARVLATDLSLGMLRHREADRPPCFAADICRLPLASDSLDDAIAPFVLNHLDRPAAALAELARVVTPGGAVLASVYDNSSSSPARDRVDETAIRLGFTVPDWYRSLKQLSSELVGTAVLLGGVAAAAGLDAVQVDTAQVDVQVHDPQTLVDYRLSQAQYTTWMASLTASQRSTVRDAATQIRAQQTAA